MHHKRAGSNRRSLSDGGLRIWRPPTHIPRPRNKTTRNRLLGQSRKIAAEMTSLAKAVPGPQRRSEEVARLEAVLFVSREPQTTRRLAKLARLTDGTKARTLLRELNRLYEESGSAFRVESIAGGYQLLTRAPFGPWMRRLLQVTPEARLSAPALETLAIVAYRQPITRSEIEAIRGVGCEDMLRQLLERDLAAIGGRTEDLGRPNVYITSKRFLKVFGLSRLEDLPPAEAMRSTAQNGPEASEPPLTDVDLNRI